MNFTNSFEVSDIIGFELKQKELLNLPGLATLRDTDEWAYATVAATQAFDQGQNRNVAGASLPAGGRRRCRRSWARADGLLAPLDAAHR